MKDLLNKKLIQEYIFLKADLEYKSFIIEENRSKFLECVYDAVGEERKSSEETNIQSNEEKLKEARKDWNDFPKSLRNKAKKIYREISKKTHPDKDPSGVYSEIFKASVEAYEQCNILSLYEICERLSIKYEVGDDEIKIMKETIEKTRENIKVIENSFAYMWSIYESEKMREIIIKQFVRATKGKL